MKKNNFIKPVKKNVAKATKLIKKSAMIEFVKNILGKDCPKDLDLISANRLSGYYSMAIRKARKNV